MLIAYYDKTFEGLLSVVFDAYEFKAFPDALLREKEAMPLLATRSRVVETCPEKAARVFRGLKKKLSERALRDVTLAWLSDADGADMALLRYIRKVFDAPSAMETNLADPDVFAVATLAKKVLREKHQWEGFIRFQKSARGVYVAACAPRHDVLPLLAPHFTDRFADQSWVIFDVKRRYGVFFDRGSLYDAFLDNAAAEALARSGGRLENGLLAEDELLFQELWQRYFTATAIRERTNERLQRRCLPRRFWRYLTEKQGQDGRPPYSGEGRAACKPQRPPEGRRNT